MKTKTDETLVRRPPSGFVEDQDSYSKQKGPVREN